MSGDTSGVVAVSIMAAVFFVYRYYKSRAASLIIETVGGQKFKAEIKGSYDGVEEFVIAVETQYAAMFNEGGVRT